MGYRGETYAIDLSRGGFSYNQNVDQIPDVSMVEGSRNVNLHLGGRSKRGGTSPVNGTPITDTPRIFGTYQFRLQNGTVFILTATSDGKIQKDYGTTLKTGLTINRAVHFETFNNLCIICTGNNRPQVWNGVAGSTSDLADVPTDWTGGNWPRKMIKHGRGVSERLWAVYGKTKPHIIYGSDNNTGDGTTEPDFSDVNVTTIHIDTGDGFGIINAVEFGDRLICAGKRQTFVIDDTDVDIANWGYQKAQWEGGTGSDRLMVALDNDIISMAEDGTVYSVVAAETYGDYKQATLTGTRFQDGRTHSPFFDEYIRRNIRLLSVDDFHMIYDPVLRAIYIFVVRQGQLKVDTALCYFIDRGPEEGWTIKDNLNFVSGYSASCSALVREDFGEYKIYTGGWEDGYVWKLETSNHNDNGNPYSSGFRHPRTHLGDPRLTKRFDDGHLLTAAKGDYNIYINIWVDGVYVSQEAVSVAGIGSTYGNATYGADINAGVYGGNEIIDVTFPIGKVGKRIEAHVFNNNVNEDFFVSQLLYDFKPLTRRAS